jgi:simple sugar transport system permease protein
MPTHVSTIETVMIIAVGAALLMIGGEFDLSLGSMIGFSGMMIALPMITFMRPSRSASSLPSPARS